MPPRHVYWTIILEGKPTAFRAHTREELAPTLRQLQARHPDAVLMWFARGRLWESPEHERAARTRKREGDRRGPEWRPGGMHRDPRDRFKVPRDEKRRRFSERFRRDRDDRDGEGGAPKPFRSFGDRKSTGLSGGRKPSGPSGARKPFGSSGDRKPFRPSGDRTPFRPSGDRKPIGTPGDRSPRGRQGGNRGGFRKPGGGRTGGGRTGGGRTGGGRTGGGRGGGRGGSSR